jgi:hypothetical protein
MSLQSSMRPLPKKSKTTLCILPETHRHCNQPNAGKGVNPGVFAPHSWGHVGSGGCFRDFSAANAATAVTVHRRQLSPFAPAKVALLSRSERRRSTPNPLVGQPRPVNGYLQRRATRERCRRSFSHFARRTARAKFLILQFPCQLIRSPYSDRSEWRRLDSRKHAG